ASSPEKGGKEAEDAAATVRGSLSAASAFATDALIEPPWSGDDRRGAGASGGGIFGGATGEDEGRVGGLSGAKTVAWAAANLSVAQGGVAVPVRATWVLELRGGMWQIVQLHLSVPIAQARLESAVYGE